MNKSNEKKEEKLVNLLLQDEVAQQIIREMGLEGYSAGAQEEFISELGETVQMRVMLEILKILPELERPTFDAFIGSGDIVGLRNFLLPHIPDLDAFIQHEVMKEYEATKTRMREIAQGIDV